MKMNKILSITVKGRKKECEETFELIKSIADTTVSEVPIAVIGHFRSGRKKFPIYAWVKDVDEMRGRQ